MELPKTRMPINPDLTKEELIGLADVMYYENLCMHMACARFLAAAQATIAMEELASDAKAQEELPIELTEMLKEKIRESYKKALLKLRRYSVEGLHACNVYIQAVHNRSTPSLPEDVRPIMKDFEHVVDHYTKNGKLKSSHPDNESITKATKEINDALDMMGYKGLKINSDGEEAIGGSKLWDIANGKDNDGQIH